MTKKYRIEETLFNPMTANVFVEAENEDEAIDIASEIFHDMDGSDYHSQDSEPVIETWELTDSEWEEDTKDEVYVSSSKRPFV